jgi:hypothetical protein
VKEASRRWAETDPGIARSASSWGRSVQGCGGPGPSLVGACASSCPFRKAIICIKQSPDEGGMPVLPNPSLRLISSYSELRIWQMIYPFRHLDEVFAMLYFNSSLKILLGCSFVGVASEYDWDTSWSRTT